MPDFPIDDQRCGQLNEAKVMLGLVFPANQQAAKAIEPAMTDFAPRGYPPPPGRMAIRMPRWGQRTFRVCLGRNVGDDSPRYGRLPAGRVVVAPVQGQMRLDLRVGLHEDGVQQLRQFDHIVPIRAGHHDGDGNTSGLGQEVPFRAWLSSVGGVSAGGLDFAGSPFVPNDALIRHPSAASQFQLSPIVLSYSSNTTAQARSKAPLATHSWNRSMDRALGSEFTRERRPLAARARQEDEPIEDRPVIPTRAAGFCADPVACQYRFQQAPKIVINPPNGRIVTCVGRRGRARRCVHASMLLCLQTFRIAS